MLLFWSKLIVKEDYYPVNGWQFNKNSVEKKKQNTEFCLDLTLSVYKRLHCLAVCLRAVINKLKGRESKFNFVKKQQTKTKLMVKNYIDCFAT